MTVPSDSIPDMTGEALVWNKGCLRLVDRIGSGGLGVVYRAVEEWTADQKIYAVKVLLKADPCSIEGRCQTREIVTHQIVSDHPNIVTLHQVINREHDKFLFLILDYCPGGDLYNTIISTGIFYQNDRLLKKLFLQILDAVQFVHDKGIFHRDLKPDNILINKDRTEIYLGDFGLATDDIKSRQFYCGSDQYMSPGIFIFLVIIIHYP